MRRGLAIVLAITSVIAALAGCGATEEEKPPELAVPSDPSIVDVTPPEGLLSDPCRAASEYENELEQLRRKYTEDHPDVVRMRVLANTAKAGCLAAADHAPRPGKWVEKDGVLECDGYMTRRADQDYCSAEIPEDWVPFTFDGKEYYMQPLTDNR